MTIRFNKKIYFESAIKQAINNYQYLANFGFNQNKNYFLVKIDKIKSEVKNKLPDEFANYILSLILK
ncbi:MAG: hypothetical protein DDT40_01320 [candidate division WS2 bacterium]|nr:hypothetical protein [Candidatus Psychracetigena formicireducens]